jgi:hypothetical protein
VAERRGSLSIRDANDCRIVERVLSVESPQANAQLIAAAPDLLLSLREMSELVEMIEHWFEKPLGKDCDVVRAKAKAAIAKARGR